MRLFQNYGLYPSYRTRLDRLVTVAGARSFGERRRVFLADRFGAPHFLVPVLNDDPLAFFTNGDDEASQRPWARENGLKSTSTLEAILLAQIEHHRTEVFYNLDPMRYGSDFVRKLPGCVRKSVAWRAAPSSGADFESYDLMVCNFPGILVSYRQRGWNAAYFSPAHDPTMDAYAANATRPIDVLFVGGYSRHHRQRAEVLQAVAALRCEFNVVFHLDRSRLTKAAESPLGKLLPLGQHRRPRAIRAVTAEPVFGRDLYRAISTAKIVLNGAVDMAGSERGNMRCFEAMGCGALMVSDRGAYPNGMEDGITMLTYSTPDEAVRVIREALAEPSRLADIAGAGHRAISSGYSKAQQWRDFVNLVEAA